MLANILLLNACASTGVFYIIIEFVRCEHSSTTEGILAGGKDDINIPGALSCVASGAFSMEPGGVASGAFSIEPGPAAAKAKPKSAPKAGQKAKGKASPKSKAGKKSQGKGIA